MNDVYFFRSNAFPDGTRVASFAGFEGISEVYRFQIQLLVPKDTHLDLKEVVGSKGTLDIGDFEDQIRSVRHGIVSEVEWVRESGDYSLVEIVLVPRLWVLTQSQHGRVFVNKSIADVIDDLLKHNNFSDDDFSLQLFGKYDKLDHVCQYQESDFDFLSRRMQREGIYFYYEQGNETEKLIITDSLSAHKPLDALPIPYFNETERSSQQQAFYEFTCRRQALPGKLIVKDYDPLKPSVNLTASTALAAGSKTERVRFGENFDSENEGKRLAKIRSEELRAREELFEGEGKLYDVQSGYLFQLSGHPFAAFDRGYLAIQVRHSGTQVPEHTGLASSEARAASLYQVKVIAIPDDVQFRPESVIPTPRIYGIETAIIDGEEDSDYAQLDEHGRYNVRILFDELHSKSGKASMRVRMLQPHGGSVEGFHFPLRKGTEVLLVFLGGDPDRPVIAGVVPNALTPSPVLDKNNSLNVLQTGSKNRMEMEDTKGSEHFTLSTPHQKTMISMGATHGDLKHNLVARTQGSGLISTGEDLDIRVQGKLSEEVTEKTTRLYHDDVQVTAKKEVAETYDDARTIKMTNAGAELNVRVEGPSEEVYHKERSIIVTDEMSENYKSLTAFVEEEAEQTYGEHKLTVDGEQKIKIKGEATHTYKKGLNIVIPEEELKIISPKGKTFKPKMEQTLLEILSYSLTEFAFTGLLVETFVSKLSVATFILEQPIVEIGNKEACIEQAKINVKKLGVALKTAALHIIS